jgi:hypothetical protein
MASAARHVHPGQLAMFMPAHAITALTLGDAIDQSPAGKKDMLWRKNDENMHNKPYWAGGATRKTVFDTEGVKEPLEIAHRRMYENYYHNGERVQRPYELTQLDEGHHRLAWAMNKDPKTELPVEHHSYGHD